MSNTNKTIINSRVIIIQKIYSKLINNDLNLNKIWCEVYSNNDAIDVYRHIGFVDEGCLRQNYFNEGQYWDSCLMSMLREEYREKYNG